MYFALKYDEIIQVLSFKIKFKTFNSFFLDWNKKIQTATLVPDFVLKLTKL